MKKKCKNCNTGMTNFSFHPFLSFSTKDMNTKIEHFYCSSCQSHYYINKWFTNKEWDVWINSSDD